MATLAQAYQSMADVNLWLKLNGGDELQLADMPSIIPLRWVYLRDQWEFLRPTLLQKMPDAIDPDFYKQQLDDFTDFINAQRAGNPNINPLQDVMEFYKFYAVFDNISIQSIALTNQEQTIVNNETARVNAFSKNDFVKSKNTIQAYHDTYADIVGLEDTDYNAAHNRSSVPQQITATITDANLMFTMLNAIKTCNFILANLFQVDAAFDSFALARANANNPDINIGQYTSGSLVKLHYNETLEGLAQRYFGDPNKWLDIAIANGLKPPYIDEVGQSIPLLSNGAGSQINLAASDVNGNLNIDKLYINQPIFLQSSAQVTVDQRTIINIRQVPVSGEIVLELDGLNNMDIYKISDQANIRVYAPNTVNSKFYVLIPSTTPLPDNRQDPVPWFLAKSAEDEKRAKIDLAFGDDGDLSFTTNGDLNLSFGLDNAIQAMKLKIVTELGTLRYHPTFGLVNVAGKTNANIDQVRDILTQSITSMVQADQRFDRIESLAVDYLVNSQTQQGVAAMAISLTVRLAGGTQVIPISFTVNYSGSS